MNPKADSVEENVEKDILWLFDLALIIKAINGALEVLTALLVLLVPPSFVIKLAEFATGGELSQDPSDFIAMSIRTTAHSFAVHTHYLFAAYLTLHGLIKVLLVIGIFAKKQIAYPLFMIALVIFGIYEAYRGFVLHELLLQAFAIFDLALLVLTSYEYRRRYSQAAHQAVLGLFRSF
ncbi:MAG: DUF2127 domain-containing protein [Candidatus Paceibacteria bacterium]